MMMPKPIRLTRIVRKMMRSGRLTASLSSFLFRHALDDHRRQRHIVHSTFGARSDRGDAIDDVHASDDAPEYRVTEIVGRKPAVIEADIAREIDVELRC